MTYGKCQGFINLNEMTTFDQRNLKKKTHSFRRTMNELFRMKRVSGRVTKLQTKLYS